MSLATECEAAISNYVDADRYGDVIDVLCGRERNAALTDEHKEYVMLVLQLLRDAYKEQKANGDANFVVPSDTAAFLSEESPW